MGDNSFKRWRRSPVLWFFIGALTMAVIGLVIALRLTSWSAGGGTSGADLQPVIHIHNAADVEVARQALIEFIFGASELPATLPGPSDGGMLVRLPNGFTSFITIFTPEAPNGALVIYHTGHEGFTGRDRAAIRAYLGAGYTVWRLDMPLVDQQPAGVAVTLPARQSFDLLLPQTQDNRGLPGATPECCPGSSSSLFG